MILSVGTCNSGQAFYLYQPGFHPDVCLPVTDSAHVGAVCLAGAGNGYQYWSSHHSTWRLSISPVLSWIYCCKSATLFSSDFSVAPLATRKITCLKRRTKNCASEVSVSLSSSFGGSSSPPAPCLEYVRARDLACLSQLSSSEVRNCEFLALEMKPATQRRGELHMTAATEPASAASSPLGTSWLCSREG